MIVLYAGRRPDADFPDSNVDFVGDQIAQLLGGLRPRVIVGSAAAGTDLLTLEAAEALEIDAEAIIVGDRDDIRDGSVADKGADWERRYDHQLNRVNSRSCQGSRTSARAIARSPGGSPSGETSSRGRADRDPRGSRRQGRLGQHRGARPARKDPEPPGPQYRPGQGPRRPAAGVRGHALRGEALPGRGWRRFASDLSYGRIMVPALIDAGYRPIRAATDALLEVIDHTMLREINSAEVMMVDLALLKRQRHVGSSACATPGAAPGRC